MAKRAHGWRRVRFGDVVRLNKETCKTPAAEGIDRYIGLEHLESDNLRVRTWGNVSDGTTFINRVRPGQVLFGKRRAYQRKVAVAEFDAICSGDIYVFESSDPGVLLPGLLPFICQTDPFFDHAVGTSAGSLSPRTNWTSLAAYEFALPPLEEQRRICEVLSAIQAGISSVDDAREAALRCKDSCSVDVFADNGRRLTRLSEVCDEITVGIVVKPAQWYVQDAADSTAIPALIMKNVQQGWLDLTELLRISRKGHQLHEKSMLRQGDVVAVRSSGSIGRTGDAAVVPQALHGANCIDLLIARPGRTLLPEYLCQFLNAPSTRRRLVGSSSGTMQKHLNVGAFRLLEIPMRPRDEQERLVGDLDDLAVAARHCDRRREQLTGLRQTLFATLGGAAS